MDLGQAQISQLMGISTVKENNIQTNYASIRRVRRNKFVISQLFNYCNCTIIWKLLVITTRSFFVVFSNRLDLPNFRFRHLIMTITLLVCDMVGIRDKGNNY